MRIFLILLLLGGTAGGVVVNDGSFENGTCDGGSDWTCATTHPNCETILNPTGGPWGSNAYDGSLAVWLGGVCDNEGISNSVCQELVLSPSVLSWWWMGYYTLEGVQEATLQITVDGGLIWEHSMSLEDHTLGTWANSALTFGAVSLRAWEDGMSHTLCFEFDNFYANNGTTTASMLVDLIELNHPVATGEATFSTIKVLY